MSEQPPPPDPRAFAPTGKPASVRAGGYRRMLYIGAPLMATCAAVWIASPGSKPHEEVYHSAPHASRSEYDPPKATQVAAGTPLQSAVVTQQPQQQPPPMRLLSGKEEEPRLASFSTGLAPIPDYMKPKIAEGRDQSCRRHHATSLPASMARNHSPSPTKASSCRRNRSPASWTP